MSNASLKEQLQAVASQIVPYRSKQKKADNHCKESANNKLMQAGLKWLECARYGVELLHAYFPACFKIASGIQPIKKGIKQDLILRLSTLNHVVTEDKACMLKSLSYYVNTTAYFKSVIEGVARVDLDGNRAGVVTADEVKYSQEKLQAKRKARKDRNNVEHI